MAEAQAVDRVHRIGQTREVEVIRYCVKDSIEEVSRPTVDLTVFGETDSNNPTLSMSNGFKWTNSG
jgi:hypothetical protein